MPRIDISIRRLGLAACLCTAALLPAAVESQALPADSLERARRYSAWFFAGQADSLHAYVVPGATGVLASPASLTALIGRFRDVAGSVGALVSEQWVWRGGSRQYWRTMNAAGADEPFVLRWVITSQGLIGGVGINPQSSSPPADSAGPILRPAPSGAAGGAPSGFSFTPAPAPVPARSPAPTLAADSAGVRRAALDYLEGFYEGDSTKHTRSINPSVYKYGFSRARDGSYNGSQMTWPEFHEFTRNVRANNRQRSPETIKEVQILDVVDQTAAVKVTAYWGIDYLLMGRFDGRWMITHVIWQSPPPALVTRTQFAGLRWLAGRWHGVGFGPLASVGSFYEGYEFVDDSTMRMYTYSDSTFTRATDSTRFELRGGILTARDARGAPRLAMRVAGDSVQWAGTLYLRVTNDRWRAIFPPRPGVADRPYYELTRMRSRR